MKAENWNGHAIRFVKVEGELWVILGDVAEAVGCEFTADDLHGLSNTESVALYESRNNEYMFIVDRLGVYEFLVKKSLGSQKDFMHWISKEMKPSLNRPISKVGHNKGDLLLSFAIGLMSGLMLVFIF